LRTCGEAWLMKGRPPSGITPPFSLPYALNLQCKRERSSLRLSAIIKEVP